jgi:protocatechuate 4,5-dioxygenase alpha chain
MTVDVSEFDDIPGTLVFTAQRSRKGYWLNQFCMSLMKAENRDRFRADERAYLDEWTMTEAQKQAVLKRDYNAALEEGGNIYFLAKVFSTDGLSFRQAVGTMTGLSEEDYAAMMVAGGRSPEGARSIKENR